LRREAPPNTKLIPDPTRIHTTNSNPTGCARRGASGSSSPSAARASAPSCCPTCPRTPPCCGWRRRGAGSGGRRRRRCSWLRRRCRWGGWGSVLSWWLFSLAF